MTTEDYQKLLPTLPSDPGIYKYIDANEIIIYVGKAKNLKKRIGSYFGSKKNQAYKTRTMIKNAVRLEYTIVETEQDALLLENTLIKSFQPRYNVMLKDGKSYTYLCIKNERFPRVFFTRNIIKDGSIYFGPYTSKWRTKQIFEIIQGLFPLRNCTLNLSADNIQKQKFKVCLQYHIKNCEGPCVAKESEEDYNNKIEQIKNILKGNFKQVKDYIKEQMQIHAALMEFEKAQLMKEKLTLFQDYQSKSTVVSATLKDVDVFSMEEDQDSAYVNYIKVINGAVMNTNTIEMKKNLNDEASDLLRFSVLYFREKYNSIAPLIFAPSTIIGLPKEIEIQVPLRGDKRKLLDLSIKNLKYFLTQKKQAELSRKNKQTASQRILKTLQEDLKMTEVPFHLECFDNSNIQGTNPTASCVVFKNAKPSKKDYRHFKIKTVEGSNDFASMEEVVYRRYKRLKEEQQDLPQLVIIDGGKGQLSSAVKSLKKLELLDKITIVGIAKKLEEIYFPGDSIPLYINKKSESLKLIQQARNESHRFALRLHRNLRSKNAFGTELTKIAGVGPKLAEKLLKKFGSVERIKNAKAEDLRLIVGPAATRNLQVHFAEVENAKDGKP